MPGENPLDAGTAGVGSRCDSGERTRGFSQRAPGLGVMVAAEAACISLSAAGKAFAQAFSGTPLGFESIIPTNAIDVIQFAIFAGVMGSALLSAIWLIRERGEGGGRECRAARQDRRSECLAAAKRGASRSPGSAGRRLGRGAKKPDLVGVLPRKLGRAGRARRISRIWPLADPAIGRRNWRMQSQRLRDKAKAFDIVIETQNGTLLEVHGRKPGATPVVRFVSLSPSLNEHARLRLEHQRLLARPRNVSRARRGSADAGVAARVRRQARNGSTKPMRRPSRPPARKSRWMKAANCWERRRGKP